MPNMILCSRCHKRIAVVFITRMDNGEAKNEGICIKCARELGIKPVDDMLEKMGISDTDMDKLEGDMAGLFNQTDNNTGDDDVEDGGAPPVDLPKIIRGGLPQKGDASRQDAPPKKEVKQKNTTRKFLSTYCQNLNERAAEGKLDAIVGRKRELDRVVQILCRRQKNNPCLIGEPGVGKTAIAEALAQNIVAGSVPHKLRGCEVYLVDLTALVAGTQFRGQFESRVLGLINEVKEAGNVILVIDEVHNIVGAGDAEGSMNAANILKPALSRGEIQVIGATTLTEYRKHIEKDAALERRFQPVMVNEPSVDDTVEILRGIKHYYEEYHGVKIPDTVLRYAVTMSERYITDRYLPDKAIDLIDEAASHVALTTPCINERGDVRDRIDALTSEYEALETKVNAGEAGGEASYKRLADIKVEQLKLSERLGVLDGQCANVTMKTSDLAEVIEIWTGIPATSVTEDEFKSLIGLEDRLKQRIVGQDEAVSACARAIRRNRAGVAVKRKPVSFIFAGPTGVGKTELVRTLADDLFKSPETLIRLDMSEFMEKHSVSRIIGSPPGYVGYDEAGQLTEKIRRRPYSVILFDEIEKAHPDVMNILLQILDDGKITDAHGKSVNFENTVIVMTTNAGSTNNNAPAGFTESAQVQNKEKTMRALSGFLRPEFLNRVDEVITFRQLDKDDFSRIARIMLDDLKKALGERGMQFSFTDAAAAFVAEKSYSQKYGARNMRRYIQTEIEDKLATVIIEKNGEGQSLTAIALDCKDGALTFDYV